MDRRSALKSFAGIAAMGAVAKTGAAVLDHHTVLPTEVSDDALPVKPNQGGPAFLSAQEARTVGAVFDRLIPADELGMGAVEAGCVTFLDRQLGGDYGHAVTQYRRGPFEAGTPQQGPQFKQTPAERYRTGLASLDTAARQAHGKPFAELDAATQDSMLSALEQGTLALKDIDGKAFFALMLQNVREGYFADPIYGGNKDMVGWKMVGFPGARYDFRDVIAKKGQQLDLQPVSIIDRNI